GGGRCRRAAAQLALHVDVIEPSVLLPTHRMQTPDRFETASQVGPNGRLLRTSYDGDDLAEAKLLRQIAQPADEHGSDPFSQVVRVNIDAVFASIGIGSSVAELGDV